MIQAISTKKFTILLLFTFILSPAAPAQSSDLFAPGNLLAWCIVPFDAAERDAEARAQMLQELGFPGYAYDWRAEHIPAFAEEIRTMRRHGIAIDAVWLWIDDSGGELLDENNRAILRTIQEEKLQTTLWIGFAPRVIDELQKAERLPKAVNVVRELRQAAKKAGCAIALYNHLGWTGEPANQVRIIEALGADDIGIVYNFHHAHEQIEGFADNLNLMLPYLQTVNLNGMRPEGPKILPLGQGSHELEMMRILKNSGYQGRIGVLGHTEGLDIRPVLQANLEGLRKLEKQL